MRYRPAANYHYYSTAKVLKGHLPVGLVATTTNIIGSGIFVFWGRHAVKTVCV